jgi:large repetitive protein
MNRTLRRLAAGAWTLRRLAAGAASLAAVAAIAGTTVSAFAGSTSNAGNTFAAAATWGCPSPGTVTASANADSWIDQGSPSNNFGSDQIVKVKRETGSKAMRTLVRFTLPAVPAGCSVTAATLRLYAASAATGLTLQALRAGATWTENGITWSNQPATTGTAATTTSVAGWNQWTVTTHVQGMYSGTNNGFLVRFAVETSPVAEMQFHARDKGSQHPELRITFG